MFSETTLKMVRALLDFEDLCSTRRVCKRWLQINDQIFPHTVTLSSDEHNDTAGYSSCLEALKIQKFCCRVYTQNGVDLVISLLQTNPISELDLEFLGYNWNSNF